MYEISTWGDQDLERQAAEVLVDTYGCGVLLHSTVTAHSHRLYEEKGVYGCGYNSDMTSERPRRTFVHRYGTGVLYYATAIKAAMDNPFNFHVNSRQLL